MFKLAPLRWFHRGGSAWQALLARVRPTTTAAAARLLNGGLGLSSICTRLRIQCLAPIAPKLLGLEFRAVQRDQLFLCFARQRGVEGKQAAGRARSRDLIGQRVLQDPLCGCDVRRGGLDHSKLPHQSGLVEHGGFHLPPRRTVHDELSDGRESLDRNLVIVHFAQCRRDRFDTRTVGPSRRLQRVCITAHRA